MEKIPPELLRGGCSLVEYDLTTGEAAGTADTLTALGCLVDLVDKYLLIGSRAETLLVRVSLWYWPMTYDGPTCPALVLQLDVKSPTPNVVCMPFLLRPEDRLTSLDFGLYT
jgi:hypothetical protein